MERSGASIQEMRPLLSGTRGQSMLQHGIVDEGIISVGQCIGLINDIPTVREVVDRIIKEAEQIVNERLTRIVK
jgi:nitronate monooxygenase